MNFSQIASALRALADAIEAKPDEVSPDWIDQAASPLGRRRHCAAVRRRIGRGEPGAAIVGRRHLLAPDVLPQELARTTGERRVSVTEKLEAKLRAIGSTYVRGR